MDFTYTVKSTQNLIDICNFWHDARMRITLYDWAPSPFCHKIRALLEFKTLAYERRPALATRRLLRRRGGVGKVPAVDIDGDFIFDSTDIAHELERRCPDPPCLPAAAPERALCHMFEDWCDEALYFYGLYYHWQEVAGRRQVKAYFGRSMQGRIAFHLYLSRILRQLWGQGLGRKSPERVRADLDSTLDAVERLLERSPFLLGENRYLCDFALMAQLVYLQRAPVPAEAMRRRPVIQRYLDCMRRAASRS